MVTITKRELNHQTSRALATADEIGVITVTERGRPRWRIEAIRDTESTLEQLTRTGRVIPPKKRPEPWTDTSRLRTYTEDEIDALVDQARADR